MADNKNSNETDEAAGDNSKKKQDRKKIIMLAVLGLCVVAASVGSTLLVINLLSPPPVAVDTNTATAETKPDHEPAIYYPIKPAIIVTYNARGRQRYVQAEVTFMFRDPNLVPSIELHMPRIRHELTMIIGGQVYEELQTAEGKELTRLQCLERMREVLEEETGNPGIEQVLFVSFVMQ